MPPEDARPLAQARIVERRARPSAVWLVPICAALIAIGLFVQHVLREGPTVTITFLSAEGVEADRTPIKYKDVTIGMVTGVRLAKDFDAVEVRARITKNAEDLMTEGASFWIVRPRVSLSQISGLGTLFSGNYIAFDRSASRDPAQRFAGLETPKAVSVGTPGREFRLHAANGHRIDVGLPMYCRGVQVGQVTSYALAANGQGVDLTVFVKAPYDRFVHRTTRFWNAGGFDVSFSTTGLDIRSESLVSLLIGGVAFEDVPGETGAVAAPEDAPFTFYVDRATAMKQPDPRARRYVLLFDESLDGLAVGSPVTMLGVPAGEVTSVGLSYDAAKARMRGRVEITLSPERLIARLPTGEATSVDRIERNPAARNTALRRMLRAGLRGQLRSANLLTGQRFIDFAYFSADATADARLDRDPPELPVAAGTLPTIERRVLALLDKLDALPLSDVTEGLRDATREARTTLADVGRLARDVDERALPRFLADLEQLGSALAAAERMFDGASATLVDPDAPAQRELVGALQQVTRAARSLRTLADSIERNPQALLFGRSGRSATP